MTRAALLSTAWLLVAALAARPTAAFAQAQTTAGSGAAGAGGNAAAADPEIDAIHAAYDYGRYDDVLEKARARIDRGGLTRDQLVQLHKYAGLAAFNLNKSDEAARHFEALLRLDPDFQLDPFAIPPPTVAFFEKLRKDLDPTLELIRQQLRIEAERQKRDEEERLRRAKEDEDRRRRLEELSRRVTVRNVEHKSFLVNFVPFGAGQFQQDRTAAGVVLAASEGAFALTSIIAYFAYNGILDQKTVTIDTVNGPVQQTIVGIPPERKNEATVWKYVKYGSALAFYTTYGYGVVDSIYHHEDEVVTTTQITLQPEPERTLPSHNPEPEKLPAAPDSPKAPREEKKVPLGPGVTGDASSGLQPSQIHPFIYPTAGGLGAGITVQF